MVKSKGGSRSGPDGGAKMLTEVVHNPKNFVGPVKKDRTLGGGVNPNRDGRGPDDPIPRAPQSLKPTSDVEKDRIRLRQALHDKIDEVKDKRDISTHWPNNRSRPCMSAVWDRKTGDIHYNHNSKEAVDPDKLHPTLKDRHKDYTEGRWKRYEANQDQHGEPGKHSESRATNDALLKAELDYRRGDRDAPPKMEDFMVENAAPNNKRAMPCCPQCTQMIDGVDGSSRGWDKDAHGNKLNRTANWGHGDEART